MKAVRIHEFGGVDKLQIDEVETPQPKAGEVLIKVHVAGINFADTMLRAGNYLSTPPLPHTMGFEVAGTIETLGENVTGFEVGQRVVTTAGGGGYAEFAVAPALKIIPIPEGLSFGQATALLVQGMTALGLLRDGDAKEGKSILIHAAAGGVGTLLVQLAKLRGLTVIGTASSASKLETVMKFGADFAVNYTEENWTERIKEITEKRGVDIIIEMAGGEIVAHNLSHLSRFGTMIVYGSASGQDFGISALGLMRKNHIVRGYWLSNETPLDLAKFAGELVGYVNAGKLEVIVQEFPFERVADAHQAIESRQTQGKVVLTVA
ncbi:MAG: quinone oxidoreductase [Pyrinomonadaceae bacterium]|nr:quinone oxidoreductase [Pyrinomonadaceae bacterium]